MNKKRVYVVHSIDTEGPLTESLQTTFNRLDTILGIKLEPSEETLKKIQNKELDLKGKEDIAARIFSTHLLDYNNSWEKLEKMLTFKNIIELMSTKKFAIILKDVDTMINDVLKIIANSTIKRTVFIILNNSLFIIIIWL